MSVVVGIVRDGIIHMAADSFMGSTYNRNRSSVPKLFRVGEALIGFSGDASAMNAIRYRFTLPEHTEDESDEHYMAVKFIDGLRSAIGEAGRRKKDNEVESAQAWLLVGYRGRLWRIHSDFAACSFDRDYEAVGAGDDFALGVLHAIGSDYGPKKTLTMALDAACEHSPWCIPPYIFEAGA